MGCEKAVWHVTNVYVTYDLCDTNNNQKCPVGAAVHCMQQPVDLLQRRSSCSNQHSQAVLGNFSTGYLQRLWSKIAEAEAAVSLYLTAALHRCIVAAVSLFHVHISALLW